MRCDACDARLSDSSEAIVKDGDRWRRVCDTCFSEALTAVPNLIDEGALASV